MALQPTDIPLLITLLQQSLRPEESARKPAEDKLISLETTPGYCSLLYVC